MKIATTMKADLKQKCQNCFPDLHDIPDNPIEVLEALERKGFFGIEEYDNLRRLVSQDDNLENEIYFTELAEQYTVGRNQANRYKCPIIQGKDQELVMCVTYREDFVKSGEITKIILKIHRLQDKFENKNMHLPLESDNYKKFMDLIDQSLSSIDNLSSPNDQLKHGNDLYKIAKKTKDLLLKTKSDVRTLSRKWEDALDSMNRKRDKIPLIIEFCKGKRANVVKTIQSCLYVFMRFETMQSLNEFWIDYKQGDLGEHIKALLDPLGNQRCAIYIDDGNYRRHARFVEENENDQIVQQEESEEVEIIAHRAESRNQNVKEETQVMRTERQKEALQVPEPGTHTEGEKITFHSTTEEKENDRSEYYGEPKEEEIVAHRADCRDQYAEEEAYLIHTDRKKEALQVPKLGSHTEGEKITFHSTTEVEVQILRETLLKHNLEATQRIEVLEKFGKKLPIEKMFPPVVIREDLEKNYKLEASQRIQVSPSEKFGKKLPIQKLYAHDSNKEDLEQKLYKIRPEDSTSEQQKEKWRKIVNRPDDMFYKDGEPVRFVFMKGKDAHWKTSYCLQLIRQWCNAKQADVNKVSLSDWENGMNKYGFVFFVPLRHVNKDKSSLLDMICSDTHNYSPECREAIRHVLTSGKYRSLVILDGLDEWSPNEKARTELKHREVPNIKDIKNCTFLIAPGLWESQMPEDLIQYHERVIEIQGLDEEGIETVIRNVLVNYFDLDDKASDIARSLREITEKLQGDIFQYIKQIPLFLISSVILLHREETRNSKTDFYKELLNMLIEKTFESKSLDDSIDQKFHRPLPSDVKIPPLFQNYQTLKNMFDVLYTLGEMAYQDLMTRKTSVGFRRGEMAEKLGPTELEFALKVGLLSHYSETPSSCNEQVSVNFLHKSIQEFQAAIYISSRNEVIDIFCKQLSNKKVIMELSNVIMFTSGLSPSLASVLSQQIVHVANTDPDICRYRDTFDGDTQNKVRLLYDLQVSCYREMKQGLSMTHSTEPLTYHVSDVHLDYSNRDTVRRSVDLMCNNPTHIVSLYLWFIPDDGERGITDRELTQILDNATSLHYLYICYRTISTVSDRFTSLKTLHLWCVAVTRDAMCGLQRCLQHNKVLQSLTLRNITCLDNASLRGVLLFPPPAPLRGVLLCLPNSPCLSTLHIDELYNTEDRQTLVDVLPKLKCLRSIQYVGHYRSYDFATDCPAVYAADAAVEAAAAAVAHTVSCMKQLQHVHLEDIHLGYRSLELTSEMSQIEKVELHGVYMSAGGWKKFVHSLINIPHTFDVILDHTGIDDESVTMIRSSPYFTVTENEGSLSLEFSRVTPSTQRTDIHYRANVAQKESQ